ncbi:Abi-like protein [Rhizobium sp. NFR07]|uniref:Abi family protein n=1 Tax=Rhizobium sp. NFR07 TaxID=1566262 RepID=UPI0008F186BF|nr:Abi family protein [Rhizobium sp. NFR07]SFB57058.1 Abi-like protein [Rhizobium sp. NFR07]
MQGEVGRPVSYEALEMALSLERFGRYLDWANGDRSRAIELYTLNTLISESLYTPLQMLEVALRNRIHVVMTEAVNESWFHEPGLLLGEWQPEQLAKAIQDIEADKKEPTPGRIVAALTFSFWTAMFGKDYETLWQTTLHKIGRKPDGKGLRRKDFSGPLAQIRSLRNRIAHHEPVIMWNLPKRYESMVEMTGWLSPAAAAWGQAHCRFLKVYPAEPIVLHQPPQQAKAILRGK